MLVTGYNYTAKLWSPKQSKIYVGRDVLAIPKNEAAKPEPWKKTVIDDVSQISDAAKALYGESRGKAAEGSYSVKLSDGRTVNMNMGGTDPQNNGRIIEIQVPGEAEARRFTVTEDTRIVFNDKGEPQLLTGGAASSGGVLKSEGADEILINFTSKTVQAGENTTVINFAGPGGEFVNGKNTTYLGAYDGATFKGGEGKLTFAGVFDNSELHVGKGRGVFSGVFTESELNGGDLDDVFSGIFNASKTFGNEGKDTFSGLFMEGSLVDGGNGNDKFTGRFIHSDIEAGEGNDELGNFRMTQGAQEFQFVASRINMGEGDNLMRTAALNSRIDMGEGENRIFGVLQGSSVRNESGNAKITALLSKDTDYTTGKGETDVTLATAVNNQVTTGQGDSDIKIGVGENEYYSATVDGESKSLEHLIWDYDKRDEYAFGEVFNNHVDMSRGTANLSVNTGENSYTVKARDEEVETDRTDPSTGQPARELQRLVNVTENVTADTSSVRTAVNVKLSTDLMLKFQAEPKDDMTFNLTKAQGFRAYSYNLGRV